MANTPSTSECTSPRSELSLFEEPESEYYASRQRAEGEIVTSSEVDTDSPGSLRDFVDEDSGTPSTISMSPEGSMSSRSTTPPHTSTPVRGGRSLSHTRSSSASSINCQVKRIRRDFSSSSGSRCSSFDLTGWKSPSADSSPEKEEKSGRPKPRIPEDSPKTSKSAPTSPFTGSPWSFSSCTEVSGVKRLSRCASEEPKTKKMKKRRGDTPTSHRGSPLRLLGELPEEDLKSKIKRTINFDVEENE